MEWGPFGTKPGAAASLTLRQLVQLPRWPERFVGDVVTLLPSLSAAEREDLERACWAHVDALLTALAQGDTTALDRELAELSEAGALPRPAIDPELLRSLRRQAEQPP